MKCTCCYRCIYFLSINWHSRKFVLIESESKEETLEVPALLADIKVPSFLKRGLCSAKKVCHLYNYNNALPYTPLEME